MYVSYMCPFRMPRFRNSITTRSRFPYSFGTSPSTSSSRSSATGVAVAWRTLPSLRAKPIPISPVTGVMVAMAMYFYASRLTATAAKTPPPPSANSASTSGSATSNNCKRRPSAPASAAAVNGQTPPPVEPSEKVSGVSRCSTQRIYIGEPGG